MTEDKDHKDLLVLEEVLVLAIDLVHQVHKVLKVLPEYKVKLPMFEGLKVKQAHEDKMVQEVQQASDH